MCDVYTEQVPGSNATHTDLYGCRGEYYGQSGYVNGWEQVEEKQKREMNRTGLLIWLYYHVYMR